jgi:DtxR family Mn-dependent transcriptional regulator
MNSEKLSPSMEMYLKTVLRLEQDGSPVRVKAIADSLGVTMPSVSEAIRTLAAKGLVEHSSYGQVALSEDGRRTAASVHERFELLRKFLTEMLRVDEGIADREACEIEHVVGEVTLTRLAAFVEWMSHHGRDIEDCLTEFHGYLGALSNGEFDRARRMLDEEKGPSIGELEENG